MKCGILLITLKRYITNILLQNKEINKSIKYSSCALRNMYFPKSHCVLPRNKNRTNLVKTLKGNYPCPL